MLVAILFALLSVATCSFAVIFGGWEGRWAAAIIVLATLGTVGAEQLISFHYFTTNSAVLTVDLATFLAFYWVAAQSHRWWPIWLAAFQLNSVVAHLATMISPEFTARVYLVYVGLWAIPGQLAMVLGIILDRMRINSNESSGFPGRTDTHIGLASQDPATGRAAS